MRKLLKSEPIINSLLDLDMYNLTMGQFAFLVHPNVPVRYGFTNRTKQVHLPNFIDLKQLREELEHVRSLRFTPAEIEFLRGGNSSIPAGLFRDEYLDYLATVHLPEISLEKNESGFKIEVAGLWQEAIYWETIILCIVNHLYTHGYILKNGQSESLMMYLGNERLSSKFETLRKDSRVKVTDFGTRRRAHRWWHFHVVHRAINELPNQFVGTSNLLVAKEYGLTAVGTIAHQADQIASGIYHGSDEEIRASHNQLLQEWWKLYGESLSIALTDTYGSEFFFKDFSPEQAKLWRGFRQDSGDPFVFGERAIKFYKDLGIDPLQKIIIFSDGLEPKLILELTKAFADRIQVGFGWGTNFTNDRGVPPISIVVKAIEACGHGLVKLSDNLDKAIGRPEDIERFMRIFEHPDIPRLGVKY